MDPGSRGRTCIARLGTSNGGTRTETMQAIAGDLSRNAGSFGAPSLPGQTTDSRGYPVNTAQVS